MKFLLLLIIANFCINQVQSWWDNGHMLTAQIAKIYLKNYNPAIYDYANEIIESMNGLDYDIDDTFVTSAVWPDDIKDLAMNFWDEWHFEDKPINPQGEYIQQSLSGKVNNAMDALERALMEFEHDDGQMTMQKAMFLRYVMHIIGDVHQPLHAETMFNQTFPSPQGDLGGNFIQITDVENVEMNLHAFWDQGAEYFQQMGENWIDRPLSSQNEALMEAWGLKLMTEFPPQSFQGADENMDFYEWANESWKIAKDFAYPLVYKQSQLTQEYQNQAQQICKKRVTLAGYRLANFLDLLFFDHFHHKPQNDNKPKKHIDNHSNLERDMQDLDISNEKNSILKKYIEKKQEYEKQQQQKIQKQKVEN